MNNIVVREKRANRNRADVFYCEAALVTPRVLNTNIIWGMDNLILFFLLTENSDMRIIFCKILICRNIEEDVDMPLMTGEKRKNYIFISRFSHAAFIQTRNFRIISNTYRMMGNTSVCVYFHCCCLRRMVKI